MKLLILKGRWKIWSKSWASWNLNLKKVKKTTKVWKVIYNTKENKIKNLYRRIHLLILRMGRCLKVFLNWKRNCNRVNRKLTQKQAKERKSWTCSKNKVDSIKSRAKEMIKSWKKPILKEYYTMIKCMTWRGK